MADDTEAISWLENFFKDSSSGYGFVHHLTTKGANAIFSKEGAK